MTVLLPKRNRKILLWPVASIIFLIFCSQLSLFQKYLGKERLSISTRSTGFDNNTANELNDKKFISLFETEYHPTIDCNHFSDYAISLTQGKKRKIYLPGKPKKKIFIFQVKVPYFNDVFHGSMMEELCSYPPELFNFFHRTNQIFSPGVNWPVGMAPCFLFRDFETGECPMVSDKGEYLIEYEMSSNFTKFRQADIVFYHYPFRAAANYLKAPFYDDAMFPPRIANQPWVSQFFGESLARYPTYAYGSYLNRFELIMGSPSIVADIFIPWLDINIDYESPIPPKREDVLVAWMASNCYTSNGRLEYIQNLMKYIRVDSYGKCLHNTDIPEEILNRHGNLNAQYNGNWEKAKTETLSRYKFILTPENSNCVDYVSEKVYDAYSIGAIPIYLGAPNIERFVPSLDSLLRIEDYPDPKDLAERIIQINNSPDEYASFFEWKKKEKNPLFYETFKNKKISSACHIISRCGSAKGAAYFSKLQDSIDFNKSFAMKSLRLAIFMADKPSETVLTKYGDFLKLISSVFVHEDSISVEFEGFDVVQMNYPQNCNVYDAIIISGSRASVYDDLEWIHVLKDFIKNIPLKYPKVKLIGICFGHQIIAEVFGGKVSKNVNGWEVGTTKLNFTQEGMKLCSFKKDSALFNEMHQDEVTIIPPQFINLAESTRSRNQILLKPHFALSCQAHPEFTNEIMDDIIDTRVGSGLFPSPIATEWKKVLHQPKDSIWFIETSILFIINKFS